MSTAKSVKPLPGFIVIEEIEPETKTASGLELPDSAQEKPQIGKVLSVGKMGETISVERFKSLSLSSIKSLMYQEIIKEKDIIIYKKYTGHIVKVDGKEYQIVDFDNVIARIE